MEKDWNNIIEQFDKISAMTDSDIDAYLHSLDENQRTMLTQLIATKRALNYQSADDDRQAIDDAWKKFADKHIHPHNRCHNVRLRRLASAACIAIFISGIAIATNIFGWWSWSTVQTPATPQAQGVTAASASTEAEIVKPDSVFTTNSSSVEIYDNVSLNSLLSAMARQYNATLRIESPQTASLRLHFEWDKSLSLERNLALLNNFDNVNITYGNGVITIK